MALMTRMTRLFRADAHAVLDHLEEPALMLRQAVREMEAALADDERRRERLERGRRRLLARDSELERTIDTLSRELDVCFAAGNDALAKSLVRRRLEAQRFRDASVRRREELDAALADLDERLDENRSRLEAMRQKAELFADEDAPHDADDGCRDCDPGRGLHVGDDEVEIAFLEECRRRTRT